MEYERIDQIQGGISISPSKLRMKLMGLHHRNKNGSSNNNSSRTSPSRIEDAEFINNLLDSQNEEFHDHVIPAMRSVCMRDTGTEMTPGTSLEPSRTATPEGATTPFRSPTSSMPSTPRGVAPTSTPLDQAPDDESRHPPNNGKKELSEQERKLKTRREIVALGVKLGKTNIASWASEDNKENNSTSGDATRMEESEQIEYEERAVAWEEAENTKHNSRYKREEIKIQAWESQKRAKLEAEMRIIAAKVERMRAQTEAKMVKKIAMAKQRSEEKRIAAEARKNRDAERTSAQAEYIRQTGRMPSSHYMCCSWYPQYGKQGIKKPKLRFSCNTF